MNDRTKQKRSFQTALDDQVDNFFSAIASNLDILSFLTGSEIQKTKVVNKVEDFGISRTTYYRKKNALEEAGVIERQRKMYSLTPEARRVLNTVKAHQARQEFESLQNSVIENGQISITSSKRKHGFLTTYTKDDVAEKNDSLRNVFTEEHHVVNRKESGCIPNTGIAKTIISDYSGNISEAQEEQAAKILRNALQFEHRETDTYRLVDEYTTEGDVRDTLSSLRKGPFLSYNDHTRSYQVPMEGKRIYRNLQRAIIRSVGDKNLENWIASYKETSQHLLKPSR